VLGVLPWKRSEKSWIIIQIEVRRTFVVLKTGTIIVQGNRSRRGSDKSHKGNNKHFYRNSITNRHGNDGCNKSGMDD